MSKATASIREIRTDFRSVKRKVEANGEIVITDNGVPRFLLRSLPATASRQGKMPDYHARLLKEQPRAMDADSARKLHEQNRGDR